MIHSGLSKISWPLYCTELSCLLCLVTCVVALALTLKIAGLVLENAGLESIADRFFSACVSRLMHNLVTV